MAEDLHSRMLDAHARNDLRELAALYTRAADASQNLDAECFFLTHAYVFALDAGDRRATALKERLVKHGREE